MARKPQGKSNKQKLYIKIRTEHPDWTNSKCQREAGYAEGTIHSAKVEKGVISTMREALEKAGVTDEKISKRINEGINALAKKRKSGEIETVQDGKKIKAITYDNDRDINFGARHQYLELASKLRGDLVNINENRNTFPEGIPMNMSEKDMKHLAKQFKILFGVKKKKK